MKKLTNLFIVTACLVAFGCRHHRNTSISFKDTHQYFSMEVSFNVHRTLDIDEYLDDRLRDQSNMSFVHSRIDGTLSFDDHTRFYIKKYPGYLRIKLDKAENSIDSYDHIRDICQGIKRILADEGR